MFEYVSVGIFTVEYILRVWVAKPKRKYIFSFFGFIDLAAILPFYISTGLDLRSLRAFRLLRLFRIFKFARYSAANRRTPAGDLFVRNVLPALQRLPTA